jgi:hypothetical protein
MRSAAPGTCSARFGAHGSAAHGPRRLHRRVKNVRRSISAPLRLAMPRTPPYRLATPGRPWRRPRLDRAIRSPEMREFVVRSLDGIPAKSVLEDANPHHVELLTPTMGVSTPLVDSAARIHGVESRPGRTARRTPAQWRSCRWSLPPPGGASQCERWSTGRFREAANATPATPLLTAHRSPPRAASANSLDSTSMSIRARPAASASTACPRCGWPPSPAPPRRTPPCCATHPAPRRRPPGSSIRIGRHRRVPGPLRGQRHRNQLRQRCHRRLDIPDPIRSEPAGTGPAAGASSTVSRVICNRVSCVWTADSCSTADSNLLESFARGRGTPAGLTTCQGCDCQRFLALVSRRYLAPRKSPVHKQIT